MSATLVHFGNSDCSRLRVLSARGYEVYDCGNSLVKLQDTLHLHPADAVIFTEHDASELVAKACDICSYLSPAPRILFSDNIRPIVSCSFNTVIEPLTPPQDWVRIIEKTVEQTRAAISRSSDTRKESRHLCHGSAETRSNSQQEQARSRTLRLQGHPPK